MKFPTAKFGLIVIVFPDIEEFFSKETDLIVDLLIVGEVVVYDSIDVRLLECCEL